MKQNVKWIVFISIILILTYYISSNYLQLMLIQGSSMEPTYHNLQLVFINKSYDIDSLQQGTVIAFQCDNLEAVLVKRIAAVPGQSVSIKEGTLLVDNTPSTLYIGKEFEYAGILSKTRLLSKGEFVVIGDNVDDSKDSRYEQVGIISYIDIIGIVINV